MPNVSATPLPAPPVGGVVAVADRLRPVLLHINRHLRRELDPLGLTGIQVSVLAVLRDQPGIGIGLLAERERVAGPSMSAQIDRLESAGYVTRTRGEEDRRRVGLRLTPAGVRVLRTVRSRRTAWLADRLAGLTPQQVAAIDAAIGPLTELVSTR